MPANQYTLQTTLRSTLETSHGFQNIQHHLSLLLLFSVPQHVRPDCMKTGVLENPPRVNPLPKQNNKRSLDKKNKPNTSSELPLVPVHRLHAHTRGVWKCSCRLPVFELLLRLFFQMHTTRGLGGQSVKILWSKHKALWLMFDLALKSIYRWHFCSFIDESFGLK